MKPITTTAVVSLAVALASHAAAQSAGPASTQEAAGASAATAQATPEAAAMFIDSVLMNGVATIIYLDSPTQYAGGIMPADVRTANCQTVVTGPAGTVQRVFEIDWRSYVVADAFPPSVTDRPAVRVLARATAKFVMTSSGTRSSQAVGVAVEPGTQALRDRLIRAMEFYGASCAPKLDGPF